MEAGAISSPSPQHEAENDEKRREAKDVEFLRAEALFRDVIGPLVKGFIRLRLPAIEARWTPAPLHESNGAALIVSKTRKREKQDQCAQGDQDVSVGGA